jgi:hypothetical protein
MGAGARLASGIIAVHPREAVARTTAFAFAHREPAIKFLRMKPGHGEILLAEGDPAVLEDEERLVEELRRQLDQGMWAAAPTVDPDTGRREAQLVREYAEIPEEADRVIFFPRAAGG